MPRKCFGWAQADENVAEGSNIPQNLHGLIIFFHMFSTAVVIRKLPMA
jgi:hypothetical protein